MSKTDRPKPGVGTSARHSLSWRLTVTIILIGVSVVALFGWAAYRQVEMSLIRAGGDRAQTVATDIADMLERSMRQNREELKLLASRSDMRAFVANPADSKFTDTLRMRLQGTPVPGIRRIEIWNESGERILEVVRTAPGIASADSLPEATMPKVAGFAPLQATEEVVFTELSEEIFDGPGADAR